MTGRSEFLYSLAGIAMLLFAFGLYSAWLSRLSPSEGLGVRWYFDERWRVLRPVVRSPQRPVSVRYTLNGEPIPAPHNGAVAIDREPPGLKILQATVELPGGRLRQVSDSVVTGPFGKPFTFPGECAAALRVSPNLTKRILERQIENRFITKIREKSMAKLLYGRNPFVLADIEFPEPNVFHIFVTLSGRIPTTVKLTGKVSFSDGAMRVSLDPPSAEAHLSTGLPEVVEIIFLTPVWAIFEGLETVIESSLESDVEDASEDAVKALDNLVFTPFPEFPNTRVKLMFCDDSLIDEGGISAMLYILPMQDEWFDVKVFAAKVFRTLFRERLSSKEVVRALSLGMEPKPSRSSLRTTGPVIHEIEMRNPMLRDEDLRLDISVNMVNVLLDAWTANGLVEAVIEKPIVDAINKYIDEYTPVRVIEMVPRFPPMVSPNWELELGGLELELKNGGGVASVIADGRAALRLRSNLPIRDSVNLSLHLGANSDGGRNSRNRLNLSCVEKSEDGLAWRQQCVPFIYPDDLTGMFRDEIMPEVNKAFPPIELGVYAEKLFQVDREFALPIRAGLVDPGVLRVSLECKTPDCFVQLVEP